MTAIQKAKAEIRDLQWELKHIKTKLENCPYESTIRGIIRDIDTKLKGVDFGV